MLISVDLNPLVLSKLDTLIEKLHGSRPVPPIWPFATTSVIRLDLRLEDRKRLDKYMEDFKVYEAWKQRSTNAKFSRSSVVERILSELHKKGKFECLSL